MKVVNFFKRGALNHTYAKSVLFRVLNRQPRWPLSGRLVGHDSDYKHSIHHHLGLLILLQSAPHHCTWPLVAPEQKECCHHCCGHQLVSLQSSNPASAFSVSLSRLLPYFSSSWTILITLSLLRSFLIILFQLITEMNGLVQFPETMQTSSCQSWLGKLWQCAEVSTVTTFTVVIVKVSKPPTGYPKPFNPIFSPVTNITYFLSSYLCAFGNGILWFKTTNHALNHQPMQYIMCQWQCSQATTYGIPQNCMKQIIIIRGKMVLKNCITRLRKLSNSSTQIYYAHFLKKHCSQSSNYIVKACNIIVHPKTTCYN